MLGVQSLKLGAISYTNSLPFFLGILNGHVACDAELVHGVPSELNARLREGHLDLSLISVAEFVAHPDAYEAVADFCIAATDEVMSVCLHTRVSIEELDGKVIAVTPESASSTNLVHVLCHHYWGVRPRIVPLAGRPDAYDAFLLIGDTSLCNPRFPGYRCIDLATAWYRATGLPFTFAVMAAHKNTVRDKGAAIAALQESIIAALEWARRHPREIRRHAMLQCPIDEETLSRYYGLLQYRMTPQHHKGLRLFAKLLTSLRAQEK